MRLICPNCSAQYEVDDGVVPDGGRDVQCSNCGHTWFQRPAGREAGLSDEMDLDDTPQDDQVENDVSDDEAPLEDTPKRQELDSDVSDILREEAVRETAERVAEGSTLETQPYLGLDEGEDTSAAVRERMDRLRGLSNEDVEGADTSDGARKDLLPDIEEINSTLIATPGSDEETEVVQEKRKRSGFRRGFILAIFIFAVLAVVYTYAPLLVEKFPQLESALVSYVDWVNNLRASIDSMLQSAIQKLTGLLSQITSETETA